MGLPRVLGLALACLVASCSKPIVGSRTKNREPIIRQVVQGTEVLKDVDLDAPHDLVATSSASWLLVMTVDPDAGARVVSVSSARARIVGEVLVPAGTMSGMSATMVAGTAF